MRKALKDLRKLNIITGINTTLSGSAVTDLLLELNSFIEEEVHVADDDVEGEDDDGKQEEMIEIESKNAEVQAKISQCKGQLEVVQMEVDEKTKTYQTFSGSISKANSMLKSQRCNCHLQGWP